MLQLQFNFAKAPIWLVENEYVLGSAPDVNCLLSQTDIQPHHARLRVEGETIHITPLQGITRVNGKIIAAATALQHGDHIELASASLNLLDPKIQRRQAEETRLTPLSDWALEPISSHLPNTSIPLQGTLVIGRSPECEVCLNFTHLSRKHARITLSTTGLEVEDLNSSNGTFVNGERIRTARLQAGDILSFDALRFRIQGPGTDLEKTTLRPGITDEHLRAYRAQAPNTPTKRPLVSAPLRPSSSPEADAIRKNRQLFLWALGLLAVLFTALILFVLH